MEYSLSVICFVLYMYIICTQLTQYQPIGRVDLQIQQFPCRDIKRVDVPDVKERAKERARTIDAKKTNKPTGVVDKPERIFGC